MSQLELGGAPDREPHCIVIPWAVENEFGRTVRLLLPDNQKTSYFVVGGEVRIRNTDEYNDSKETLRRLARTAFKGEKLPLFSGVTLRAEYHVWYPDAKVRDKFNYMKLLNDALNGILYADDSLLVDSRVVVRGIDRQRPRIEVTVHPHPTDHAWLIPKTGSTRRKRRGRRKN